MNLIIIPYLSTPIMIWGFVKSHPLLPLLPWGQVSIYVEYLIKRRFYHLHQQAQWSQDQSKSDIDFLTTSLRPMSNSITNISFKTLYFWHDDNYPSWSVWKLFAFCVHCMHVFACMYLQIQICILNCSHLRCPGCRALPHNKTFPNHKTTFNSHFSSKRHHRNFHKNWGRNNINSMQNPNKGTFIFHCATFPMKT